ncbi:alpha-amylase [Treponema zuelzerae]|uniref:Alpha-amylase n=1 Tax=Teretinema zuelzerae TaxID=156 RepID=A0AAE3EK28_9SPIR|nr:alpha-amylase family glycosyl hydrolase [Teretinema zuelzerae]MCD1655770.1 alpha-amylase [Teretinema zuelzerae]
MITSTSGFRVRFGAVLACFLILPQFLLSCAGSSARIDPEAAVYNLAPVARAASSPSEGVYYCVFVRSFADSDGDGVGDFKGLTAKLDYLNDGKNETVADLGVTGIWLMPMFPSQSYHGYNVDDYYAVNPEYGSMEDFETFLAEADRRGISVIIDMTCNHSSTYTDWFISSRDPESPYRDWYRWISPDDSRYNLKQKIWGHNLWNKYKDSYYAGLFESGMPDFNLANPAVREEFKKITSFWMDKGVDGFRFDAAGHVFNAAKLASGEESQSQGVAFWKELVGHIRAENPEAYTVGEVWDSTGTRAVYMQGLGSTFHFDLGTRIVDMIRTGDGGRNNLANTLFADYETYREFNPDYVDAPFLTNHDQNRISGMLKGDPAQLKLSASLYLFAEGVPFIYYGEEIGLMGAKPDEQIRTPMLWNDPGKDRLQTSWIESKYNRNTIPVARQNRDKDSLLNYYRRAVRAKTAHPALYRGRLSPFDTGISSIVSWKMSDSAQTAYVFHNVSSESVALSLPFGPEYSLVFATYAETRANPDGTITLPPRGSAVFADSVKE